MFVSDNLYQFAIVITPLWRQIQSWMRWGWCQYALEHNRSRKGGQTSIFIHFMLIWHCQWATGYSALIFLKESKGERPVLGVGRFRFFTGFNEPPLVHPYSSNPLLPTAEFSLHSNHIYALIVHVTHSVSQETLSETSSAAAEVTMVTRSPPQWLVTCHLPHGHIRSQEIRHIRTGVFKVDGDVFTK